MGTKSGELLMGPDFCSKCASLFSDIKDISLGKNTAGKQFFLHLEATVQDLFQNDFFHHHKIW
jgi:hypothetical protein